MSTSVGSEDFDPRKYLRILQRRWWIALLTCLGTIGGAGLLASTRSPSYETTGQILVEPDRQGALTGAGEQLGHVEALKREATPLDTQAGLLQAAPLRMQVIEQLQLRDRQGNRFNPLKLPIKIEAMVGTDIIHVTYTGDDRYQAANIVNQLMQAYIGQNQQLNKRTTLNAKQSIEQALGQAEAKLSQAAIALQTYRQQHQIVELDKEAIATVDGLKRLTEQIQSADADLANVVAQQQALQDQLPPSLVRDGAQAAALSQTPAIQAGLLELQQAQSQLEIKRTRYRANHPDVEQLQRQVDALRTILNDRIAEVPASALGPVSPSAIQVSPLEQNIITESAQLAARQSGLRQQRDRLSQQLAAFEQRSQSLPRLVQDEGGLKQEFALAQQAYQTLRNKQSELRLAEIQSVANARIIQSAVMPSEASHKARNMVLLAGCGAGVCLGVAAAFGADLLDRRLKTIEEIRAILPQSLLGVLPQMDAFVAGQLGGVKLGGVKSGGVQVAVVAGPPSIVHESYRMLQTNLNFLNPDRQAQTIVVSSALPGEGKSTVSANLAATLAQSGYRVLLIDADLRSPSQHRLWDLVNRTGLSHWIFGTDAAASVVQPVLNRLDVMPSGVLPPNTVTFLESDSFRQRLQELAPRYDYVLIDSPPLLGNADAAILSKVADGLLLVARPGVVDDRSGRAVQEMLQRSGSQIMGLVVNGVHLKRDDSPLFYYPRGKQQLELAARRRVT